MSWLSSSYMRAVGVVVLASRFLASAGEVWCVGVTTGKRTFGRSPSPGQSRLSLTQAIVLVSTFSAEKVM